MGVDRLGEDGVRTRDLISRFIIRRESHKSARRVIIALKSYLSDVVPVEIGAIGVVRMGLFDQTAHALGEILVKIFFKISAGRIIEGLEILASQIVIIKDLASIRQRLFYQRSLGVRFRCQSLNFELPLQTLPHLSAKICFLKGLL